MVQAYNFLGSWQLFPEKGTYEMGQRPISGLYKIEAAEGSKRLSFNHSWVSLEQKAFSTNYTILADGALHPFEHTQIAKEAQITFHNAISFDLHLYHGGKVLLHLVHEIMPNGYLRITQQGFLPEGNPYTNTEVFHKQLSVLPYAAAVSGAVIRPTKEGVIRHKALTAMEEQTNMQLEQIRKQVELLALQAQEIHKRKELSLLIYNAKLSFKPDIGQVYHLYEKADGTHTLSMISPKEWGSSMPYNRYVAAVQLLADHTWKEL
jgi:hypothetical protein